jgi:hypothetical protein
MHSPRNGTHAHSLISVSSLAHARTNSALLPTQYVFRGAVRLASTYVALGVESRGDSSILRCGDAVNVSVNGEFRCLVEGTPTDTPRPAMFLCAAFFSVPRLKRSADQGKKPALPASGRGSRLVCPRQRIQRPDLAAARVGAPRPSLHR